MNNEIAELCKIYGTIIFNSININATIEQLASKYGTQVYHG